MTAGRKSLASLRAGARAHTDLLSNSSLVVLTTAANAALGFVFWIVAARFLTADVVGIAAAAISATTLIGTIGMFGMGTLLISSVGTVSRALAGRFIVAGIAIAGIASFLGGLGYVSLTPVLFPAVAQSSLLANSLIVVVTVLTAIGLVLDETIIGLLSSGIQLLRNLVFAAVKLALLVVLALLAGSAQPAVLLGAWAIGLAVSLVVAAARLRSLGVRLLVAPRLPSARMGGATLDHNLLNIALLVPTAGLPLLVAAGSTAAGTGAFYIAFAIVGLLNAIPSAFTLSLFAAGAREPEALGAKLRVSLAACLAVGVPMAVLIVLLREPVLHLFGPSYAAMAAPALALLAAAYLPRLVPYHFIAIGRVGGRIRRTACIAAIATVAELCAAWAGLRVGGLTGLALSVLVVVTLEALVFLPTVLAAVRSRPARTVI
ncbi:hypothetical protein BJQ94_12320 [Cryobacterium sp. SO2]|uniref:hypothetical protein n=1 Tax=Cryobacterium sp. SO2 TaxID=1897060 RepID=UPI00223E54AA|nr:hypothetical protein [Cryobacterium sp. SO2]WEO76156.1 hypothetical protein BJQ94_12320 [Cryobacterium sp. SO2]